MSEARVRIRLGDVDITPHVLNVQLFAEVEQEAQRKAPKSPQCTVSSCPCRNKEK